MAIQSVTFTGHKKQNSPAHDILSIVLKSGLGAAAGYAVGKYVLPVSNEYAEKELMENLVDSFIEKQPKPKAKKTQAKEDGVGEVKISKPKTKTALYKKLKDLVLKQYESAKVEVVQAKENKSLDKLYNEFEQYAKGFFENKGGKAACVEEAKSGLKYSLGKRIALFAGGISAFAAIVDVAYNSARHKPQ